MKLSIAFYQRDDGDYDRYEMELIDFNEAKERFPDRWSLETPTGGKIHDQVPAKIDVGAQVEAQSRAPVSPPIVKRPVSQQGQRHDEHKR